MAKGPTASLAQQFLPIRRVDAELAILKSMNGELIANSGFGIYSESPFLRPTILLRPVQFASPSSHTPTFTDTEGMIRQLKDLADQKVSSVPLMAIISGSKPNAQALGFVTDTLLHVFNLPLDLNLIGFLNEQMKSGNAK